MVMTGRTHDLAAFTALIGVLIITPVHALTFATVIAALVANQIGGIAPDIDQPTAPLWRNLPIGGTFGRIVDKLLGGHRGLSHSILGLALFGYLVERFLTFIHPITPHIDNRTVWLAFMIGMVSHLVMDSFTKEGVAWLLPIPINFGIPPLKSLRITTGKWVENFIVIPILALATIYLLGHNYTHMVAILHLISR
jgi:inner membrane protein